jgi:hypothetical protein
MDTRQDRTAIDPDRDGPWQLGDWVWAAICWAVLILCYAAIVYTMFEADKPVH